MTSIVSREVENAVLFVVAGPPRVSRSLTPRTWLPPSGRVQKCREHSCAGQNWFLDRGPAHPNPTSTGEKSALLDMEGSGCWVHVYVDPANVVSSSLSLGCRDHDGPRMRSQDNGPALDIQDAIGSRPRQLVAATVGSGYRDSTKLPSPGRSRPVLKSIDLFNLRRNRHLA